MSLFFWEDILLIRLITIIALFFRYSVGDSESSARQAIKKQLPSLQTWQKRFVKYMPTSTVRHVMSCHVSIFFLFSFSSLSIPFYSLFTFHCLLFTVRYLIFFLSFFQQGSIRLDSQGSNSNICISKVLGVEESIWSPMWGLKGKIDVSVEFKVIREHQIAPPTVDILIAPLELKTGENKPNAASISHKAQVMLYSLLMADFYGT